VEEEEKGRKGREERRGEERRAPESQRKKEGEAFPATHRLKIKKEKERRPKEEGGLAGAVGTAH
jgi:hypothetical protein